MEVMAWSYDLFSYGEWARANSNAEVRIRKSGRGAEPKEREFVVSPVFTLRLGRGWVHARENRPVPSASSADH